MYQEAEKKILENDLVWLYTNRPSPQLNRKFQSFFTGPFRVIKQLTNTIFKIEAYGNWNAKPIITTAAIDRLKRCTVRDPESIIDVPITLTAADVQPYFEDSTAVGRISMSNFAPHIFGEDELPDDLDMGNCAGAPRLGDDDPGSPAAPPAAAPQAAAPQAAAPLPVLRGDLFPPRREEVPAWVSPDASLPQEVETEPSPTDPPTAGYRSEPEPVPGPSVYFPQRPPTQTPPTRGMVAPSPVAPSPARPIATLPEPPTPAPSVAPTPSRKGRVRGIKNKKPVCPKCAILPHACEDHCLSCTMRNPCALHRRATPSDCPKCTSTRPCRAHR